MKQGFRYYFIPESGETMTVWAYEKKAHRLWNDLFLIRVMKITTLNVANYNLDKCILIS